MGYAFFFCLLDGFSKCVDQLSLGLKYILVLSFSAGVAAFGPIGTL
jgi:hypothetical protein